MTSGVAGRRRVFKQRQAANQHQAANPRRARGHPTGRRPQASYWLYYIPFVIVRGSFGELDKRSSSSH